MEKIPMTAEGYQALDAEMKRLKTEERPSVIQAISEARDHGDLSENAEYHAAHLVFRLAIFVAATKTRI
jgi:transcription elongation factor GreA